MDTKQFAPGDEVKVRDEVQPRLGIIAGQRGCVGKVTHSGSVVHVYVYAWQRTYIYGASEIERV